jgi:hypothetical protein
LILQDRSFFAKLLSFAKIAGRYFDRARPSRDTTGLDR